MKLPSKLFLLLSLLAVLLWPQKALAQGPGGDQYVFGGTYTLPTGETLDGNLYVFGGLATLEEKSVVNGDVILAGGTLRASGETNGDIFATGGLISLEDSAVVNGDISTFGAQLNRSPGARVTGEVNTGVTSPFRYVAPGDERFPFSRMNFHPLWDTLWFLFRSFLWAALAVLVVMFLPRHTERAAQTAVTQPLISLGLGLLTFVVVPLLLVVIAITIIGIPVSLLGALLLVIAWGFGIIALGAEVGRRIGHALNQEWALAVAAGVGTFVLVLVTNGLRHLIPCVGWLAPALVGMLALGAVLLTRFGTQTYPLYAPVPPQGPIPPAAPVVPPTSPTVPPTYPVGTVEATEPPAAPVPLAPEPEADLPLAPASEPGPEEPEDEDRSEGGAQVYPLE